MFRAVVLAGAVFALWRWPLFHVRSLSQSQEAKEHAAFSSPAFATQFWQERLLPSVEKAVDVGKLMASISTDKDMARKQFAHAVGISSGYYYFVRGTGRVVKVEKDAIGLSLNPGGNETDVSVPLGPVFGNALRDGTGLLNASDYPNSQDFNDIAASLNHIAETRVLPELQRIAAVGRTLRFAGCVEVADEEEDLRPLKLVPALVKAE
jgi:predicted lipoprotein